MEPYKKKNHEHFIMEEDDKLNLAVDDSFLVLPQEVLMRMRMMMKQQIIINQKSFKKTSLVNLNAIDNNGQTCIHHLFQPFPDGTYTNNIEMLRLLHSCGASLTITDLSGLTPLQYSIQNNSQHLSNELTSLINIKKSSMKLTLEQFKVNDPNKKLLDKPDYYNDAQHLIDEYISTHPASKYNAAYKVDRLSGMSLTGEVLIDTDKNEPYDVRLTKTDVSYGTYGLYNFYRMQIIKHKSKNNLYFLFTRWGRIGIDEGQHQLTPYSTFDECRKEFLKVFREKQEIYGKIQINLKQNRKNIH